MLTSNSCETNRYEERIPPIGTWRLRLLCTVLRALRNPLPYDHNSKMLQAFAEESCPARRIPASGCRVAPSCRTVHNGYSFCRYWLMIWTVLIVKSHFPLLALLRFLKDYFSASSSFLSPRTPSSLISICSQFSVVLFIIVVSETWIPSLQYLTQCRYASFVAVVERKELECARRWQSWLCRATSCSEICVEKCTGDTWFYYVPNPSSLVALHDSCSNSNFDWNMLLNDLFEVQLSLNFWWMSHTSIDTSFRNAAIICWSFSPFHSTTTSHRQDARWSSTPIRRTRRTHIQA
jgi:hypothetical protein